MSGPGLFVGVALGIVLLVAAVLFWPIDAFTVKIELPPAVASK